MSIVIPQSEFQERIVRFQAEMAARNLDAILVYGDEYRKENLRYVSNFWPIFERAVCMIPKSGNPVVAGAPEGESYAKEMSVWKDYVNVREFACVSVPEEIDYLICATVHGDYFTPSLACLVQKELGLRCPAIDINAACASFIYGLDLA